MPFVRIPAPLRSHTGDQAQVSVDGATAGEVLDNLVAAHPGLGPEILDGGELKTSTYESMNLLIRRSDYREIDGRATPVAPDEKVMLLRTWPAAISGGKQWNQPVGAAPPD